MLILGKSTFQLNKIITVVARVVIVDVSQNLSGKYDLYFQTISNRIII